MRPVIVSGWNVTGNVPAMASCWPIFSLSLVTVSEVFVNEHHE